MSKIDLVRGEPSLLELFRALRSSSEAQRTLLLFSRFARRFSSTAEGKVKSFKSFQIIQIFLFVRFVQICSISAPFGALLYFSRLSARRFSSTAEGKVKSFKSSQIIQIFLFVRFVPICRISAPQGALLLFPFHHNVPMLVELVLWMFLVAMTDIRFCFPTCLERLDEVVAVIAHLVTPHFVNGSHHLLIWSQR